MKNLYIVGLDMNVVPLKRIDFSAIHFWSHRRKRIYHRRKFLNNMHYIRTTDFFINSFNDNREYEHLAKTIEKAFVEISLYNSFDGNIGGSTGPDNPVVTNSAKYYSYVFTTKLKEDISRLGTDSNVDEDILNIVMQRLTQGTKGIIKKVEFDCEVSDVTNQEKLAMAKAILHKLPFREVGAVTFLVREKRDNLPPDVPETLSILKLISNRLATLVIDRLKNEEKGGTEISYIRIVQKSSKSGLGSFDMEVWRNNGIYKIKISSFCMKKDIVKRALRGKRGSGIYIKKNNLKKKK